MNLLIIFFCFALLALQELLIEGQGSHGGNKRLDSETGRSRSPANSNRGPHGIYEDTFREEIIQYLTEDNNPADFGTRYLRKGVIGRADQNAAKSVRRKFYRRRTPEVSWGLKDLEAFANLVVPHTDQNYYRWYYRPFYYGYTDETFDEHMHQVTAPFITKNKPYKQICCSVFVKMAESETPGIREARCGHPICYVASKRMTYWSFWGQWTCRPPPIREEPPIRGWLCNRLIIERSRRRH